MAKSSREVLRPLIEKRIRELDDEREQLRALLGNGEAERPSAPRRRKPKREWTVAQRKAVGARMRKMWAERRKAKQRKAS